MEDQQEQFFFSPGGFGYVEFEVRTLFMLLRPDKGHGFEPWNQPLIRSG